MRTVEIMYGSTAIVACDCGERVTVDRPKTPAQVLPGAFVPVGPVYSHVASQCPNCGESITISWAESSSAAPLSPRIDYRDYLAHMVKSLEIQKADGSWRDLLNGDAVPSANVGRGYALSYERRGAIRGRLRVTFREPEKDYGKKSIEAFAAQSIAAGCTWDAATLTVTGPA